MRESSARLPAHQAGAGAGASSAEDGGGALQCSSWSAPSSPHRAIWEATHTIFTRHTGEGVEGRPRPGLAPRRPPRPSVAFGATAISIRVAWEVAGKRWTGTPRSAGGRRRGDGRFDPSARGNLVYPHPLIKPRGPLPDSLQLGNMERPAPVSRFVDHPRGGGRSHTQKGAGHGKYPPPRPDPPGDGRPQGFHLHRHAAPRRLDGRGEDLPR